MSALNDLNQTNVQWQCGTSGLGLLISDSLMFERGDPAPSDPHLGNIYGLALPLVKRGLPVSVVQLENAGLPGYLDEYRVLLLTYQGMKPLSPEFHTALAKWVKRGGALVMVDDDTDAFNAVREWWNSDGMSFATPRLHLLAQLGLNKQTLKPNADPIRVGAGQVFWLRRNPVEFTTGAEAEAPLVETVKRAVAVSRTAWRESNYLLLRRGPYVIATGLEESIGGAPMVLPGKYVDLFDSDLELKRELKVQPGSRYFLLDLTQKRGDRPLVLASACNSVVSSRRPDELALTIEGVDGTPAVILLYWPGPAPRTISLDGQALEATRYSGSDKLLWLRFTNRSFPRQLKLSS